MADNDAFRSWLYTLIVVVTKVFLLILRVWKTFITWVLNLILSILLIWPFNLLGIKIVVSDFGFLKVQGLYIGLRKNTNLSVDISELKIRFGWSFRDWRNLILKVYVKDMKADFLRILRIEEEDETKLDGYLSCIIEWKIFSTTYPATIETLYSGPYSSVQLVPKFDIMKRSFLWLEASEVIFETKMEVDSKEMIPFTIESERVDVVLFPMPNHFVLMASTANATAYSISDTHLSSGVDREEQVVDLEQGEILACWAFHGPSCFTYGCRRLQVLVLPGPLELVLKMVDKIVRTQPDESSLETRDEDLEMVECREEMVETMFCRLFVLADEITISIQNRDYRELIHINAFFNYISDQWRTKIKDSVFFGVSATMKSLQEDSQDSESFFMEEKETSKLWPCRISRLKRPEQSSALTLLADKNLLLVLKPGCFKSLSAIYSEFSHLIGFTKTQSTNGNGFVTVENLIQRADTQKIELPDQQIDVAFKGFEIHLLTNDENKVAIGAITQVELIITKDTECTDCKFDVVDFEVKDCVMGGMVATKQSNSEQKCEPLLQFTVKTLPSEGKTKTSFRNLYGKLSDLNIVLEEEFLFRLLQFSGIEGKNQLWGDPEEQTAPGEEQSMENISVYDSGSGCKRRCYFERLELEPMELVLSLHRSEGPLPNELQKLKERLEIPQIMPPQLEKVKVSFASFLRTRIYYRSLESVVNDLRRHYLKEVGLQSAKILGSLHLLGNVTELRTELAEGLNDLKETGDYAGFVRHLRKGLSKSYQKFTDSWAVAVTGSPTSSRSSEESPLLSSPVKQASSVEVLKQQKGQEFLRRLKVDFNESQENELFLCCLKLRYEYQEDKLNAIVSSHTLYIMRVGPPIAQNVVLRLKFQSLLKAQYKFHGDQHYLELVTRLTGTRKLSIASRDPADSPLVRCDSMIIACRACDKINQAIRKFDELEVS